MLCKQQHALVVIVQLTEECTAHTLRKRLSNDPPVGDRALYCNAPAGSLGEHGHAIYHLPLLLSLVRLFARQGLIQVPWLSQTSRRHS